MRPGTGKQRRPKDPGTGDPVRTRTPLTHIFLLLFIYLHPKLPTPTSHRSPLYSLSPSPLPGYPPTLIHQVFDRLGASSPAEARQGSPVKERFHRQAAALGRVSTSVVGEVHMGTELHVHLLLVCWGCLILIPG